MSYGNRPFGLRQIVFESMDGETIVPLPVARTLAFNERAVSGEMIGDDTLADIASYTDAAEWSLEVGGLPLEAYALVTGRTATESGSTPNRTNTLVISGGDCRPYFVIKGRAIGPGCGDDTLVTLHKCKVTGSIGGQFANGEFYVQQMSGMAVHVEGTGIYTIVQRETAAAIPTS